MCKESGNSADALPLKEYDAYDYVTISNLPVKGDHQDPFDQMLVHNALRKNLILLSVDKKFKQYEKEGLQLIW